MNAEQRVPAGLLVHAGSAARLTGRRHGGPDPHPGPGHGFGHVVEGDEAPAEQVGPVRERVGADGEAVAPGLEHGADVVERRLQGRVAPQAPRGRGAVEQGHVLAGLQRLLHLHDLVMHRRNKRFNLSNPAFSPFLPFLWFLFFNEEQST